MFRVPKRISLEKGIVMMDWVDGLCFLSFLYELSQYLNWVPL